jgi:putative ABC transport system permease protein
MQILWQDIRYAARKLLRNPTFAGVAVITIALGVGAVTAVFTVVDGVLLRPLPYDEPERLVRIWGTSQQAGNVRSNLSEMDFLDFRNQIQVFEGMAAFNWTGGGVTLSGPDGPERLRLVFVSHGFFSLLGIDPELGRTFLPEEDRPGNDRVVVLSHGLWARRFASDPNIIGRTLILNALQHTVVGVMPRHFRHPEISSGREPELWIPLAIDAANQNRSGRYLRSIARLSEGIAPARARAELDSIAENLEKSYPDSNTGRGVRLEPLHDAWVGDVRLALIVLLAAVGLVLVIACVNVASLFLARASSRRKEFGLRAALGAGRSRLIRQMLTESLLIGLIAGILGFVLAVGATEVLVSMAAESIPRADNVNADLRAAGFALSLALATGLVFGLVPVLGLSKSNLQESLKEGAQSAPGGLGHAWTSRMFVVLETALAFILVVGAMLLIQSFLRLEHVDPGFETDHVITMNLSLSPTRYPEPSGQSAFYEQLLVRVRALAGVESAAVINYLPLAGGHSCDAFTIDARPPFPPGAGPCAEYRRISSEYFGTMEIVLLRGRDFDHRDHGESPPVAIIDESMARRFWKDEDPLGERLSAHGVSREIVGVVRSVKHFGPERESPPALYVPHVQDPVGWQSLVVRTLSEPSTLVASVRTEVGAMDSDLPVFAVQVMEHMLYDSVAQPRFRTSLLGVFATVALILAAVGVYGVVFHSVSRRIREFGTRMALGAKRRDVLGLVVKQGMILAGTGVGLGLLGALVLARFISSLVFEVSPTDPLTFAGVSVILMMTSFFACFIPARRASRVDPIVALRYE